MSQREQRQLFYLLLAKQGDTLHSLEWIWHGLAGQGCPNARAVTQTPCMPRVMPAVGRLLPCVKHSQEGHGLFPWASVVPAGDGRRDSTLWSFASVLIICPRTWDGTFVKGLRTI